MAMTRYLAMTAAEIRNTSPLPPKIAWMACHFSPYTTGLSNLPRALPEGSLLIVNDVTPIHGHDPDVIAGQLRECVEKFQCPGILLDFQRTGNEETAALVTYLVQAPPCPVAVSEPYARELGCPVFLSPPPLHAPLEEHLAPWQGRDIWLEMALEGETIALTEEGAIFSCGKALECGRQEEALHCHYRIEEKENAMHFSLWRTREDLEALLKEAEALGVTHGVGLFQELHTIGGEP